MPDSSMAPGPVDALMDFRAVSKATTLGKSTIRRKVTEGEFPAPTKLGRVNVWRASAIQAWIDSVAPAGAKEAAI